jgi:benzoyl-CoA 2,3-dioxygenase component B
VEENALTALNMRLRDDYSKDAGKGVGRWNKIIKKSGIEFEITLPHCAFHRMIGEFTNVSASPEGTLMSEEEFSQQKDNWLPSQQDGEFIQSLMRPVVEPGHYANWIAAPKVGVDRKPGDFEYVQLS